MQSKHSVAYCCGMNSIIPNTVNLHSLIPCNYSCGFCYAAFTASARGRIPQTELHEIIQQIADAPLPQGLRRRKVTFAGGEPLLCPTAIEDIEFARECGLVTSLVTNGSLLTEDKLERLSKCLDWLVVSIDSLSHQGNLKIGRSSKGNTLRVEDYLNILNTARLLGISTKVNTVVNRVNAVEDFVDFMREACPERWKVLQACRIEGENSIDFSAWAITEDEFEAFKTRHSTLAGTGVEVVYESDSMIYGSYAMVAPNGCFFDNSTGEYRYSRPITEVGIEAAFREISFSWETFRERGGDYDYSKGQKEVSQ